MIDWDDAYANMAYAPGADRLPEIWTAEADAYRKSGIRIEVDIPYGELPRERMDLVLPDGSPEGLIVFVHGGYWLRFDKSFWTQFAEGARARGWAVALPQYTLAPDARLTDMARQVARAVRVASDMVSGPVRLAGHSAGGHLVTRLACDDDLLDASVRERVDHTVSISGLHDLRPLMWTEMNATLKIDEAEAMRESPALLRPSAGAKVTAWVGGDERPEFIRQAGLLHMMWSGLEAEMRLVEEPGHNHFTIIDGLRGPESALTECLVGAT